MKPGSSPLVIYHTNHSKNMIARFSRNILKLNMVKKAISQPPADIISLELQENGVTAAHAR